MPAVLAGLDGCPGGWVAAIDAGDGRTRLRPIARLADLTGEAELRCAVIDIPIGLPGTGARTCDREARMLIGPRRSSVFPAPLRAMVDAADHAHASSIRRGVEGKGCSRQLANIIPKVREVDGLITPHLQRWLMEGHPEVSFALMNGGTGLAHHKRGVAGRAQRMRLLEPYVSDLAERLAELPGLSRDAVDAYALLWTARRVARGTERRLPGTAPPRDGRGLRMEIVA